MILAFTDSEYAVIVDSLAIARRRIGGETPNIDTAITKFNAIASPAGCQFLLVAGEDAEILEPHIRQSGSVKVDRG